MNESLSQNNKEQSRRGHFLIEPYKQLRFGVMFLFINLVFSILFLMIFGYVLWDIYEVLSTYFKLDQNQSLVTMSKLIKPGIFGLILIIFFIMITLFISAKYTHQIYGPLVSIVRFLDDLLNDKKPKPIKLRSSDQLQELVEKLNGIAQKFVYKENRDQDIERLCQYIDALISEQNAEAPKFEKSSSMERVTEKIKMLHNHYRSSQS